MNLEPIFQYAWNIYFFNAEVVITETLAGYSIVL